MRILFTFLTIILFNSLSFTQTVNYKIYSDYEFFRMIEEEQDSIFSLKNAIVTHKNKNTSNLDSRSVQSNSDLTKGDTTFINKAIELENVHFIQSENNSSAALNHIVFNRNVKILNSTAAFFNNCIFNGNIEFLSDKALDEIEENVDKLFYGYNSDVLFSNCIFRKSFTLDIISIEVYEPLSVKILNSEFYPIKNKSSIEIAVNNIRSIIFEDNTIIGDSFFNFFIDTAGETYIANNNFGDVRFDFLKASINSAQLCAVEDNIFNKDLFLTIDNFNPDHVYRWNQWKNKVVTNYGYTIYMQHILDNDSTKTLKFNEIFQSDSIFDTYKNKFRFENAKAYKYEMRLLGNFYDFYKAQHDKEFASDVYVELKNLETKRFKYLYHKNPSFDTFFTWKINSFLSVFSAYGTKPSNAIIFSFYVIIIFGFIYLFFPNSWDKHGRNRIINRYSFFIKYMNTNSGIHQVYLDDKNEQLMEYEEFKKFIESSNKTIPSFFTVTALPLYKWAISGTKLTAAFLRRIDIVNGSWNDLPSGKRFWKLILLIGAFLVAIVYDVFIKVLNALMLSLNTFTTLGFGEIPIKGLPRYLAIIQGFIGWFMLTIFSVSLISQLLN